MAFFGEDGLQRQLKQFQRDLMAKDREIGTMHLSAKEKDEALKKLRQEIERLQEEKEVMAGGAGSSPNHDHDSEENHRLKTQIRDLQDAMSKLQMDGNRLREEARQTSVQLNEARLRKISGSSSSSSNTLASPASSRSSRRRSTSLSSDSRVMDLEAELSILRQNASSPIQVDSLKTQIANARRDLNKAINEKITVESRAKKDVDAVKSLLEDANYELDGLRRELEDGGSGTRKELVTKQKAWDSERSELAGKVKDLEATLATGRAELAELRSAANEAERLKEELDQARSASITTAEPEHSGEVARLYEEVASLQAELARAQTSTPTSSSASSADLTVRRLERRLEKAQRDYEALEEALDRSEEENQALRSHIPLPSSPCTEPDDGRMVELETDDERLQGEVSQLQTQLTGLREALEQLQASAAKAEQAKEALHSLQESLQSKEADWNTERKNLKEELTGLRDRVSEAETAIEAKTGDIATKEAQIVALTSSLAESESQIQTLSQQLEEAARNPQVSQLENDIVALRSSVESLSKDKEEAARLSASMQAKLEGLGRDLSTSREDLAMDRAGLDVLRVQLAQKSSKQAAARVENETIQEQLDIAVREKIAIENELDELRTSLADRSTDSEADSRNGELLVLKSELDQARHDLQDKERELEEELQGLRFIKQKDAETADKKINGLQEKLALAQESVRDVETKLQAKITGLEGELQVSQTRVQTLESENPNIKAESTTTKAGPTSSPDRLGLLYSKIQSLRAERDDLRQSLSFAQNESRFTIRAAQADRESAIEELEVVKSDLAKQLAVHESLEQEVSSVRDQLNEKEIKLEDVKNMYATATIDKGDVADKIAQYESEVASAKNERDHLVQELGESHRQIMELNHAMAMMRTTTDPGQRMRKISMERKTPEMPIITETSTGVAVDRGPISLSSSRRPGHSRTKSEIASLVLPDQAQITGLTAQVSDLESQNKVLSGKLERRNASIQTLQRDNEKLSMAQELSKDSAEEFEELVTERDGLQAELDILRTELGTTTTEIDHKAAQVLELEGVVTGLRSEQASTQAMAEEQIKRVAELEASVASQMAEIAAALSAVDSHKLTIEGVEKALILTAAESTDQLRLLILNILAQRQRLTHATDSWRRASNLLQYQTTALDTAKLQIKTLTGQVDAFEAERSAMSQQFQSHTQRAKALDTANEKVHELESQVETLESECAAMAEQLDVVAAREKTLVKQTEDASATQQSLIEATTRVDEIIRELSQAREEITRLEREIITTEDALTANDAANARIATDLTQELDNVRAQLAASEARASDSVDELKKLSSQIERLERLADDKGDSVEDDSQHSQVDMSLVERSEVNVNHTVIMVDSLRQHVVSVEKTLHDEKAKSEELAGQCQSLTSRLAEAESQAQDAVSKEADFQALQDTVDEMTREIQVKTESASDLSKLCDTLRAQVSELTIKLEQATESATDHTLALQAERGELQKKLGSASEKADALRMEVSSTMTKNQLLTSEVTTLTNDLQVVKTTLAHTEKTVEDMRVDMENLEKEKEKTVGLLKYQETETMSRTNKVLSLERELQNYKTELSASKEALAERKIESTKLEAECADLRSALVEAQANAGSKDDSELQERIAELEASLMIKTQEVDEADDRTREAFKAKAKVDKKVAKLTRQLGDKELEMNTKRNKVIAMPDPTPVTKPVFSQMAPPTSTIPLIPHRAPLRQVDNLEPAAHIISTPGSLKRVREGDDDQKPLPAEAIMLPPSAPTSIMSKTPNRRSFTPKRTIGGGAENADMKSGARNIFGSGTGARPNIFAPGE